MAAELDGRPPPGYSFTGIHPQWGAPIERFTYRDQDGVLFWECRYKVPADASIGEAGGFRLQCWRWDAETLKAVRRPPTAPRALYHLNELREHPDWPIYLFSGPREAESFKKTINGTNVLTTSHCGEPGDARWTDIAGRQVTLWPTNDDTSFDQARSVIAKLIPLKCTVRIVSVPRETRPPSWSVCDAIEQGWTAQQLTEFADEHAVTAKDLSQKTVVELKPKAARASTTPKPKPTIEPQAPSMAWRAWNLDCQSNGLPYQNTANVCRALDAIAAQGGSFGDVWYDEFAQRIYTRTLTSTRAWEEADTISLQCYLQNEVQMKRVSKNFVHDAVVHSARRRTRNPVREWLQDLHWDGTERLSHMLSDGWGAVQNEYTAAVGRCFLMGAVARILKPGCQVDMLPVFEGGEGIGKTTALRDLFTRTWHAEPSYRLSDKDFYLALSNKWCIELSELAAFKGVGAETINSVVTRVDDYYRAPYERMPSPHPRMCVFAGTTNAEDWNHFEYGARRYLPVRCGALDNDWIRCYREQLFAEAMHRYLAGESWWDVPYVMACLERDQRRDHDAWAGRVENFCHGRDFVTIADILEAFGIDPDKWTHALQQRVKRVFRFMGWFQTRRNREGIQVRGWRPPNPP